MILFLKVMLDLYSIIVVSTSMNIILLNLLKILKLFKKISMEEKYKVWLQFGTNLYKNIEVEIPREEV